MIEPTVTALSRFVYTYLYHEPPDRNTLDWELPPAGRLSGGNDALPWIALFRDLERFQKRFPELTLISKGQFDCSVHILSGGVTTKSFLPLAALRILNISENALPPLMPFLGLFQMVVLRKEQPFNTLN